jgi:hypothetical protein
MSEIIKETVVSQQVGPKAARVVETKQVASGVHTAQQLVYFVFGLLEVMLVFRLILKLAGANTASAFVRFVYGITAPFIAPFEGIFRRGVAQGIETASVLEPSVLLALVVYALVAWGIAMLIQILSRDKEAI